jgi:hypothetical protein
MTGLFGFNIGIRGFDQGREDDPFWISAPSPLDAPAITGPISRQQREDLQIWAFAITVGVTSSDRHPIGIEVGGDPPDRVLSVDGQKWGLELTELTVTDARNELAHTRAFGRRLEDALNASLDRFDHLVGRRVFVAKLGNNVRPDRDHTLAVILEALLQDKGCVGDGVDLSAGLPNHLPISNGIYGDLGSCDVQVYRDGQPGRILVSTSAQTKIHRSEALAVLESRIGQKDSPKNDALLISCGLPDMRGYVCPLDWFLFLLLSELFKAGEKVKAPKHLRHVAVHFWGSNEWFEVYQSENHPVPWPSKKRV